MTGDDCWINVIKMEQTYKQTNKNLGSSGWHMSFIWDIQTLLYVCEVLLSLKHIVIHFLLVKEIQFFFFSFFLVHWIIGIFAQAACS